MYNDSRNQHTRQSSSFDAGVADEEIPFIGVLSTSQTTSTTSTERQKYTLAKAGFALLLCLNVGQFLALLSLRASAGSRDPWYLTYSPAQEAVEYEVREFTAGFKGQTTKYMTNGSEPTDELDKLWQNLWKPWGFVGIPRDQAAQLSNLTAPIPGWDDHYLVGIDVFHQLHCLDNLRKALRPERYDRLESEAGIEHEEHRSPRHLDHCVDSLRQSLMCSSDISTIHFDWLPSRHAYFVVAKQTHTCRNFEKLRQWTMDKNVLDWDPTVVVHDPLKDVDGLG